MRLAGNARSALDLNVKGLRFPGFRKGLVLYLVNASAVTPLFSLNPETWESCLGLMAKFAFVQSKNAPVSLLSLVLFIVLTRTPRHHHRT